MEHPTINDAKALAMKYRKRGVIIISLANTTIAGASYGMTRADCREMGKVVDQIVDRISSGDISFPFDLDDVEIAE